MPDENGNETPRERKKREREEFLAKAAEDERRRKQKEQEKAAFEAALEEAAIRGDMEYIDEISKFLGDDLSDIESDIKKYGDVSDKDVQQALEAINQGKKDLAKGKGKQARNKIRKNKDKIKRAHKKAKKKKGGLCSLILLGLVGTMGAALYGMYEGASAIIGALW